MEQNNLKKLNKRKATEELSTEAFFCFSKCPLLCDCVANPTLRADSFTRKQAQPQEWLTP